MDDKIIATNESALVAKYGAAGLAAIRRAVNELIAADRKRGIRTRVVCLDRDADMRRCRGAAVTRVQDQRQNKAAVDAIFRSIGPDYLMILGSTDVVPHQQLVNRVKDDEDRLIPSDLPYACAAEFSTDPASFIAPERVVSRLPDLTRASEPSYLIRLLRVAANYRPRDVTEYAKYFGLSTFTWRRSTALSLFNMFGESRSLLTAPPITPKRGAARVDPLAHFINCHGADVDAFFYGQKGRWNMPKAFSSTAIDGRIREGTIAAVECCYGAQLYDSITTGKPMPIGQNYLAQGAYAYFGSTTIAYGPAVGNGEADFITQYFLLAILLTGASTGHAALEARQRFVRDADELDPVNLKTLAQFILLGDPSVHPASIENATGVPKGAAAESNARFARRARRVKLIETAQFLQDSRPVASKIARDGKVGPGVQKMLSQVARDTDIADSAFTTYTVSVPPIRRRHLKRGGTASRYHVATGARIGAGNKRVGRAVTIVAKEADGRIVGYRVYLQKT